MIGQKGLLKIWTEHSTKLGSQHYADVGAQKNFNYLSTESYIFGKKNANLCIESAN